MQITSNSVQAVSDFYKKELSSIYSESELNNITRWILEHQLKKNSSEMISDPKSRINESDLVRLEQMCFELKKNVPYQYVLGESEFYRLKFKVDRDVLIPRPETEELVEKVITHLKSIIPHPSSLAPSILDIGTGSGCIPVSVKKNMPLINVYALDISGAALEIAKQNAERNEAPVNFFVANILKENAAEVILSQTKGEKLDVIVSNPPYVLNSEKGSIHKRVLDHEPHLALFVEDADPILFYRRIAEVSLHILKKQGRIYFECHSDHVQEVRQMLVSKGFKNACVYADLSGLTRFAEATAE